MMAETQIKECERCSPDAEALAARAVAQAAMPQAAAVTRSARHHTQEMEALSLHRMSVRSEALRAAIADAIKIKADAYEREVIDNAAQDAEIALCRGTVDPDPAAVEAAKALSARTNDEWMAWRRKVDAAAKAVLGAPFADLNDVLARADAAAQVIGSAASDGLPGTDEDREVILLSYRAAILEMLGRNSDREPWDAAVADYQHVQRQLEAVNFEFSHRFGDRSLDDCEVEDPRLIGRLRTLYDQRDAAREAIYAGTPADLDGLLVLMEIVFEHVGPVDVSTYALRQRWADKGAPTEMEMISDEDDAHRRALALLAKHTARLRDLEKPRDWRDAMETFRLVHQNGMDALHLACEKGMHWDDLQCIQLQGQPRDKLPILLFANDEGQHWVRPDGAFRHEPVR